MMYHEYYVIHYYMILHMVLYGLSLCYVVYACQSYLIHCLIYYIDITSIKTLL